MIVVPEEKIFYIDVDNTLALWENGGKYRLNPRILEIMIQAKVRGQGVVVWSAGGAQWAEKVIRKFKIEHLVDVCISKPVWWADDLTADEVLPVSGRIKP